MPTHINWPDKYEIDRLTTDLLTGRATVEGEIAQVFLRPLIAYLRWKFPGTDPDLCETAGGDAILKTIRRQDRYDPGRLRLDSYLKMAAGRDLQNLVAKEARHKVGIPLDCVAEPPDVGNILEEEDGALSWDDPRLIAVLALFEPSELVALRLMREGERETAVFVEALGLHEVSLPDRAAAVKRYKDRLKKRLVRALGGAK